MTDNSLNLSTRAIKMLERVPRNLAKQPQTRAEIEKILEEVECPTDHPIVSFQLSLGGYSLDRHGDKLLLGFTNSSVVIEEDGLWYCEFAEIIFPPYAQDPLVMDQNGWLSYNSPFSSSIRNYIEGRALEEELEITLGPTLYGMGGRGTIKITVEDVGKLEEKLASLYLVKDQEASDEFEQWWVGPDSYFHILPAGWTTQRTLISMANNLTRLTELREVLSGVVDLPSLYYKKEANLIYAEFFDSPKEKLTPINSLKAYKIKELLFCEVVSIHSFQKNLK